MRYFSICNLYLFLWVVYASMQFMYANNVIPKLILVLIVLLSIFYYVDVNRYHPKSCFINVLNIFVLMILVYGLVQIAIGPNLKIGDTGDAFPVSTFSYFIHNFESLLPIYAAFSFTRAGVLDEKKMRIISIIFVFVMLFRFWIESLLSPLNMVRTGTNNHGYDFVGLIPLLTFWFHKKWIQYIFLVLIMFHLIYSMKRGAIVIGVLCLCYYFLMNLIHSSVKQKIIVLFFISLFVIGIIAYFNLLIETNPFFKYRYERTLVGDSSGRNIIYSHLLTYYLNRQDIFFKLFGGGANHTIAVAGINAHNDWIELAINNGVFGVIMYVLYFIALLKDIYKNRLNIDVNSRMALFQIFGILFLASLFSMSYGKIVISVSLCLGYYLAKLENLYSEE